MKTPAQPIKAASLPKIGLRSERPANLAVVKIASWNVRSLMNKRTEISHIMDKNNIDLLAVQESCHVDGIPVEIPNKLWCSDDPGVPLAPGPVAPGNGVGFIVDPALKDSFCLLTGIRAVRLIFSRWRLIA